MIESIIITLLIGGSLVSLGLSVKGRMAYYFVFVCAAIGAAVRAPEPTNWFVGLFILPLTIMVVRQ